MAAAVGVVVGCGVGFTICVCNGSNVGQRAASRAKVFYRRVGAVENACEGAKDMGALVGGGMVCRG